jgi:single-stranded-DNA-specific exonuclease
MTDLKASQRNRTAPKQWIEPPGAPQLPESLHQHHLLHQLLAQRGIRSASEAAGFLDRSSQELPDPFRLVDMDLAVDRITRAIVDGVRIAIFGDYDVDGITSAAVMQLGLQRVADDPSLIITRLPNRAEGYGLNKAAIDEFVSAGVTLLVAVDCASTDEHNVDYARSLGMDVLIVDHHHMTTAGPSGAITVSPARPDCGTYREMSAAGLSLLLIAALESSEELRKRGIEGAASEAVDLAALGIVADVSSMLGANRSVVREGLLLMRKSPRIGIRELCSSAGINVQTLNTTNIGFNIAPRLNAAGRMSDPNKALELLLTDDPARARRIAADLEVLNYERRRETDAIVYEVLERHDRAASHEDPLVVIESAPAWKTGVLGLAAGKLAELLGLPVILLSEQDGVASGSARSVEGFNIIQALHRHADILGRFGGHSQAAGLTIDIANMKALRLGLSEDASKSGMALPVDRQLRLDADIETKDLTLDIARMIIQLSPFGIDNPEPVFRLRNVPVLRTETMGQDRSHLRIVWRGPAGEIRAPFFGAAYRVAEIRRSQPLDLACTLSISHWNGPRADVKVLDFRDSRLS